MIKDFGDRETEKIWNGIISRKLPRNIQDRARRKLRMLNNSLTINDLQVPPSNRLERLKGTLKMYHSIRINDQWRIIFKWENENSYDVKIVDYH
ncbi:MAG: proteic killer suppression protein [Bacteroidia bacterium]